MGTSSMSIRRLALILLLASGCGYPCPEVDGVAMTGVEPAPYADLVFQVVKETGCEVNGRVNWFDKKVCDNDGCISGLAGRDACGNVSIFVYTFGDGRDATRTALAHELGHICLNTQSNSDAEVFAQAVNNEARSRIPQ